MRILGRLTSSNVQKVLWVADELGVACEREDYGGAFGRNDSSEYLGLNPNGLVPTVIDDGLVLWESNTICRYLANKAGAHRLYPSAPGPRALVERWMDWQLSVIIPAVVPLFVTLIRTPEDQRDPAAIARLREAAAAPFRLLEAALDRHPYLEGEALTLADIGAGIWTHRWFGLGYGDPDGNLGAWYRRLGERAGYRKHVMIPLT